MKLNQLFSIFTLGSLNSNQKNTLETEIEAICFDTRFVVPRSVFVAVKGTTLDGHDYIQQAIEKGACAVVVENPSKLQNIPDSVVVAETEDSRMSLDILATLFYRFPSQELVCLGVTGTNGKTSITLILEHILNANKKLTGIIGTVNHRVGEKVWATESTTPDPVTMQKRLREFVDSGAVCAAMEVTSHALDQKRVESVQFNVGIFTNLTLDHLDYHKTMNHYFESKQKLFSHLLSYSLKRPKFAIINTDDQYGRRIKVPDGVICWTYGQKESDFRFKILSMDYTKTQFELLTPVEKIEATLPLSGLHTIYNVIASVAAALSCGVSIENSFKALQSFKGVPGRLQKVDSDSKKTVFVDYAHTPDALENVLKTLISIRGSAGLKNNLITVFGCGGDRDKSKRPIMGKIATDLSDFTVITSDNPRTEDPVHIVDDILVGLNQTDKTKYHIEVDREKAIAYAIEKALPGDVILIAGKGHEDYQIIGKEKRHFSDFEVAQKFL